MCTQAKKTTSGLDGQHQDVNKTPVEKSIRMTEEMKKVRPWCGQPSDRGRPKNITEQKVNHSLIKSVTKYVKICYLST